MLTIECEDPWFSLLADGTKPVEGRKGKRKYLDLKPGELICFQCPTSYKSFIARVTHVEKFGSLIDYLNKVTLKKALPGVSTFEEGIRIYSQWSTQKEIEDLGFVAIWISID